VLDKIGNAVRAFGEIGKRQQALSARERGNPFNIKSGTKGAALAGQHHRTHAGIPLEARYSVGDGLEHGRIKRIHLVRTIEPDVGDAIRDGQPYAIFHDMISLDTRLHRQWLACGVDGWLGRSACRT
jgi:hypothetical protein